MIHQNILTAAKAWIESNDLPDNDPQIGIRTFVYKNGGESIDVDVVYIRSRKRYSRIEYYFNGKLMKVDL